MSDSRDNRLRVSSASELSDELSIELLTAMNLDTADLPNVFDDEVLPIGDVAVGERASDINNNLNHVLDQDVAQRPAEPAADETIRLVVNQLQQLQIGESTSLGSNEFLSNDLASTSAPLINHAPNVAGISESDDSDSEVSLVGPAHSPPPPSEDGPRNRTSQNQRSREKQGFRIGYMPNLKWKLDKNPPMFSSPVCRNNFDHDRFVQFGDGILFNGDGNYIYNNNLIADQEERNPLNLPDVIAVGPRNREPFDMFPADPRPPWAIRSIVSNEYIPIGEISQTEFMVYVVARLLEYAIFGVTSRNPPDLVDQYIHRGGFEGLIAYLEECEHNPPERE
ncbi:hypothetical protein L5515_018091 [Caenorhabditis briggsae]|uniref:Uncharacterized protein n=1 Tax=Caenorhabditis briggsae TaxID=6238 RepID=A0AAE9JS60_CAEBR|nr:hypothetical protein L5515_018091 [Caenorhabditis briggsae]